MESRNLYLRLPTDVAEALFRVAGREWRHPKEQAGLFIADGLRRLGELPGRADRASDADPGDTGSLGADQPKSSGG